MKKTFLVLALAFVAFVAVASVTDPPAHNGEGKSRIYYFVHPYIAYHTYTVAPVYYPRYYVTPVYPVIRCILCTARIPSTPINIGITGLPARSRHHRSRYCKAAQT